MAAAQTPLRHLPAIIPRTMSLARVFWHQIRARPRLLIATILGLSTLVFLPASLSATTRALLAWDVGAGLYLALAWAMMLRANVERMRRRAKLQDDGAVVVLALTVLAAVASLAAIVLELMGAKGHSPHEQHLHLALSVITILFSWFLVHTAFALHYAHEFYDDKPGSTTQGCLAFPGNSQPKYLDFMYFAFVLGTTSQTSDVTIRSSAMRRLALIHGVIAFFFNTTLLALVVNIAAGLI
jgi:uncharacterized membrane protein